jgi:hypothetical protein
LRYRFRGFGGRGSISDWYGKNWLVGSQAKGFFTLHHLIEGVGSWPVHSESTSLEASMVTGEVE